MSRRTTICTIGCLAVFSAGLAHAQQESNRPIHELTTAFGLSNSARRDRVVSPAVFDGIGWDVLIRDRAPLFGADLFASASGGSRSLDATTSDASESLYEATLRFDVLEREHSASRRPRFGIDAQLATTLTDHRYWNDAVARKAFVYGAATLGPVARWSASGARGAFSTTITAPIIGMVVHPYSAMRAGHPLLDPRGVTASGLIAPDFEMSYATHPHRAVSLFSEYHASATRYDGALPVRGFTQSIVFGVQRRTGGSAR